MFDSTVLKSLADASLVVWIVLALLFIASFLSWTVIAIKWVRLRRARQTADRFEDQFWSGVDLGKLYEKMHNKGAPQGMAQIFSCGFKEYMRLHKQHSVSRLTISDTVHRAMRVALSREVDALEGYLSFLATVGSTSPYVGLFGTVWGIMNSFAALSNKTHMTIADVAPGISEALIATAIGLFAAIPAVIAYNSFANKADRLVTRYDNFLEEFIALLQRQALARDENVEPVQTEVA